MCWLCTRVISALGTLTASLSSRPPHIETFYRRVKRSSLWQSWSWSSNAGPPFYKASTLPPSGTPVQSRPGFTCSSSGNPRTETGLTAGAEWPCWAWNLQSCCPRCSAPGSLGSSGSKQGPWLRQSLQEVTAPPWGLMGCTPTPSTASASSRATSQGEETQSEPAPPKITF